MPVVRCLHCRIESTEFHRKRLPSGLRRTHRIYRREVYGALAEGGPTHRTSFGRELEDFKAGDSALVKRRLPSRFEPRLSKLFQEWVASSSETLIRPLHSEFSRKSPKTLAGHSAKKSVDSRRDYQSHTGSSQRI